MRLNATGNRWLELRIVDRIATNKIRHHLSIVVAAARA